ncbi:utrophin-like [Stegostoma tigrinum]|uniref:utrophin-like n=1 Tax=Stegostoma tigrinum TaxID=3053191 RepID=UPI0028702CB6|nr:utrophin-like [Stegostoma tigrinum]
MDKVFKADRKLKALTSCDDEPTLEERAQRIAKAVRKQSIEVKENWEQLKTRASNWQKQVEKALEKLQELQKALDDLEAHVITAEGVHTDQQPVGDLLIDSLQGHIDKTTTSSNKELNPQNYVTNKA